VTSPFRVAPEATLWPPDPQEPVPSVPPSDKPTGPPPLRGPEGGLRRNLDHVKLLIAFALVRKLMGVWLATDGRPSLFERQEQKSGGDGQDEGKVERSYDPHIVPKYSRNK